MTGEFDGLDASIDFSLQLFHLLREHNVALGTLQTIACTQSIVALHATRHEKLLSIYRLTLINRRQDWYRLKQLFDALLQTYLNPTAEDNKPENETAEKQSLEVKRRVASDDSHDNDEAEDTAESEGYSAREIDHHKDFRYFPHEDYSAVLALLERVANKYASVARRKTTLSHRGRIVDLRASVRESVKYEGELLSWRFKKKQLDRTRLVFVVDVSGSMEVYGIFLLNFLYFLNRNRRLKIDVFVFSTHLQPLTTYFQLKNFQQMLDAISLHFSGWSGGTKIGAAIADLEESYSAVVTPKSTVVIMSDGWDTGDIELLDRSMARIANRAKSVVWINPLKGDVSYEPLAMGMATAMPYCDEFISGHSIESLEKFADMHL